jgi:hypothetical protein
MEQVQLKPSLFQYVTLVFQVITAVSIVSGLIMIPIEIGRRDQILTSQQKNVDELRGVVSDLVKSTINLSGTDRVHDRDLLDLRTRLDRLEAKRG